VICTFVATIAFLVGVLIAKSPSQPLQNQGIISSQPKLTKTLGPFAHVSDNPIADVVASVEPSVVSIDTTISQKETPALTLPELLAPKSHLRDPEHYEAHGSGSGVIVRQDGYILTNAHVVKDASDIKITLNDGRVLKGRVIGKDSYSDIAVVKIDATALPVVRMGESKNVRPGDWAIAIGTPLGLSHTVTMGIVSAIGRSLADLNNNIDLIQTDAAINPGNSGGPLLNINGEVIGINMAIRTDAQNIGFSVPIDIARDAVDSILANRPILHPYLGISMIDFDPDLVSSVNVRRTNSGVVVSKVNADGPAADSGISAGDLIQTINNTPVRNAGDVQRIVRTHKVGTRIFVRLLHSGRTETVSVLLKAFPASQS
jgi:S1-C subfamily serine protease